MLVILLNATFNKKELILNAIAWFAIIGLGFRLLYIFWSMMRKRDEVVKKLSDSNIALTRKNKSLEDFAHITSHNLRAPLQNLLSLCEMQKDDNLSEEIKREINDKIHQSILRLDSTLNDIVDVINSKSGDIKKEKLDIENEFYEALGSIESQIKANDIQIETNFTACPSINYHKQFLNSIFLNLLSNSIKYKSEERKPALQVKTEIKDGQCVLHFKDNGIGMDLEKFGDRIFGLYQRFHSGIEGRGLGLYIIKSQIETLEGKIKVESKINQGTSFQIYF